MNNTLDKIIESELNFYLVDVRKFAYEQDHLEDSIRHYKINIYNDIAKDLIKVISEIPELKNKIDSKKYTRKYFMQKLVKSNLYRIFNSFKKKIKYKS